MLLTWEDWISDEHLEAGLGWLNIAQKDNSFNFCKKLFLYESVLYCILQNDFSWSEIEIKHNLFTQGMITAVELNVHGPSCFVLWASIFRLPSD